MIKGQSIFEKLGHIIDPNFYGGSSFFSKTLNYINQK